MMAFEELFRPLPPDPASRTIAALEARLGQTERLKRAYRRALVEACGGDVDEARRMAKRYL